MMNVIVTNDHHLKVMIVYQYWPIVNDYSVVVDVAVVDVDDNYVDDDDDD